MSEKKKILLVEDHPIFRLGLAELINQESDLAAYGSAGDVEQAIDEITDIYPDLIIADLSLKQSDGLDLVKYVKQHHSHIPVLVLSMHDEYLYAPRALSAGAHGYIMKQEAVESVVEAIHLLLAGKIYLNDKVKEHILLSMANPPEAQEKSPFDRLTDRELQVFKLIGRGFSTREIAERLFLSIKTIGTYRERIKKKLNIKHASELVRCAVHFEKTGHIGIVE
ncbi:DNA-binding response regulator [Desulfobacter hydrogenophilus]|uniref:DNA-binding response regulator n=1 Tax=Desulfobacter hydrogenophilus TaxID=2291 RepID=A0A328FFA7_9BACT|nr:response regulator transcription factor [Desulfobacter hydrogenophilus]NDY70978.1 response regulator transcription factor [Desulfobacter hydrogenophilus]QBH12782.1 response regulator transcription factor [Desulfobacter hydrogenophilus]RAM03019.1 DNA-binding response regulator [Desulfobacter hydrogenophilus]